MNGIDGPASSAEAAAIKAPLALEANIKKHDLQIISGNSQAKATAVPS